MHSATSASTLTTSILFYTQGTPDLESLDYDPSTGLLICTSTGGPVTEVEWERDGVAETGFQGSKIVTNTVTAAYTNTLLLDGQPENVIGDYSCTVRNSRGPSTTLMLELSGEQYAVTSMVMWGFG
jgi:hypothetical protein